jgi:hypothetical protein
MNSQKKVSFVELFAQTDVILLAGLLRDQPHGVPGRKNVTKLIGECSDVPKAT